MYFGKSDGADAAQLPSLMSVPKSEAISEHISSAPELAGMFGNVSAGITVKRYLLPSEVSVPRSEGTSRVIVFAVHFRIMFPTTEAFRTATPGSSISAPLARHFTDDFRSVASSVTVPFSAVMRMPLRASRVVFEAVYFSATCHALRKAERSSSNFMYESPS